jgi:hypothetical protein
MSSNFNGQILCKKNGEILLDEISDNLKSLQSTVNNWLNKEVDKTKSNTKKIDLEFTNSALNNNSSSFSNRLGLGAKERISKDKNNQKPSNSLNTNSLSVALKLKSQLLNSTEHKTTTLSQPHVKKKLKTSFDSNTNKQKRNIDDDELGKSRLIKKN